MRAVERADLNIVESSIEPTQRVLVTLRGMSPRNYFSMFEDAAELWPTAKVISNLQHGVCILLYSTLVWIVAPRGA